jgi:prepilin-type N-terminal cleavage/methylation domain-containing protein
MMECRPQSRGFTLLEALVVLVITSLVSVVLVQGFGLLLSARTSVQDKLVEVDEAVIEQSLFLEPLRGVVPDYPDRPHIFAGEAKRLHGMTTRPLQGRTGTPVPFTLTISYDSPSNLSTLTYQEDNTPPLPLGSWQGETGAFAYRDIQGAWRETWPPENDPRAPQTPWLIRLERGTGFPKNMIASVNGTHRRPLRFRDTPFGADTFIEPRERR